LYIRKACALVAVIGDRQQFEIREPAQTGKPHQPERPGDDDVLHGLVELDEIAQRGQRQPRASETERKDDNTKLSQSSRTLP
jgi:hypothetical protein